MDRSFVAELADGHAEIASAVIALARNLNLCTVAEGVETVEQAEELARLGATYLQGFSLAKPMTGGHAAAWFAAHEERRPMTVTPLPVAGTIRPRDAPVFDIEQILASIDTMAAQRPVAAQIVSVANSDDTSAKALSRILASDVALASRVMKLANSAYFGMRGRVTSLQFAVTVVGFTTVRTMATVALTNLDDESRLPEDFWDGHDQPRAGRLDAGPPVRRAPAGRALPRPAGPDGRRAAAPQRPRGLRGDRRRRSRPSPAGGPPRRRRYGINSLRLTAVALEQWGFPRDDDHAAQAGRRLPLDGGRAAARAPSRSPRG